MIYSLHAPIGCFGNHVRWLALLDDRFPLDFVEGDKEKFILKYVYADDRSWNNWLRYEWGFRNKVMKHLFFSHFLKPEEMGEKRLAVSAKDPEFAYKAYLKFNSGLNNTPERMFLDQIIEFNAAAPDVCNSVIYSEDLFTEFLPFEEYRKIIQTFDLDDNYSKACIIHRKWYNLHKKAEFEFVRDITALYS